MYSEDSIIIKADLPRVFEVAEQIDKYGDFIPSYKGVKILSRGDNSMTLERTARIACLNLKWTSEATIKKNEAIVFDQIGGPLRGMHTEWRLSEVEGGTKINISHNFSLGIPIIGGAIEGLIYNLFVKGIAQIILVNMKEKLEGESQLR